MSFFHMLYQLLIGPLELIFETVFGIALNITGNAGLSIVALSLTMNILLLPLYKRADSIQAAQRAQEDKLAPWVSHIKKTFSGDERFMILQTYYRQNNYKPYYSLRGSLPLLLEIPFFIAAYHFLSNLEILNGLAFGPIRDLGAPDGLLTAGGVTVHVLPVLMTLINFISSAIYTKGSSLKDKIQLYGMALIFLILLYPSPAGLVFYWTLNNLFSLGKNIVYRLRRPKAEKAERGAAVSPKGERRLFTAACLFLALLTGVLIPSSVVLSSPEEFVLLTDFYSPLRHVLFAALLAAGLFVIWFGIFYYVSGPKVRKIFTLIVFVLAGIAVTDYMFFGTGLGTLSASLKYDTQPVFSTSDMLLNLSVLAALAAIFCLLFFKKQSFARGLCVILGIAVLGMSAINIAKIQSAVPAMKEAARQAEEGKAHFTLSRDGKNVVVLMLDRGISSYLPYLFQEKPELAEQFRGFTYYPNTLSFGAYTNFGVPCVYGGYEYTPEEMNKRTTEKLADKHDEALKLMPVLFQNAGFDVTVCDPPYAGYHSIPDLSVFDDYPEIHCYNTEQGQFSIFSESAEMTQIWESNFFRYSIMKISPLILQPELYQGGSYFKTSVSQKLVQVEDGLSKAVGMKESTLNSYAALYSLPEMTRITDGGADSFLIMSNQLTHEPMLFQEPDYVPAATVDNTEYDLAHLDRFTVNGRTMRVENINQMEHYHINMAAFLLLGQWFDYLRENGVWDNTRIIVVADHGRHLAQFDDWKFGSDKIYDVMFYNPLLLVKDFGSTEFSTDDQFMTNADVPTLALEGLVEDPVNPFTGKAISSDAKLLPEQHITTSQVFQISVNNGTTFQPAYWFAVRDNIFDMQNWRALGKY